MAWASKKCMSPVHKGLLEVKAETNSVWVGFPSLVAAVFKGVDYTYPINCNFHANPFSNCILHGLLLNI